MRNEESTIKKVSFDPSQLRKSYEVKNRVLIEKKSRFELSPGKKDS